MKKYISLFLIIVGITTNLFAQQFQKELVKDVGQIMWQTSKKLNYSFKNENSNSLKIQRIEVLSPDISFDFEKSAVAPKADFHVSLTIVCSTLGHFHKRARIYIEGQSQPLLLGIKGEVISIQNRYKGTYSLNIDQVKFSTNKLDFKDVNKGENPMKIIYIKNDSKEFYTPSLMMLPPYLKTISIPEVIAPGREGRILMTLNSSTIKHYGLIQASAYFSRHLGENINKDHQLSIMVLMHAPTALLSEKEKTHAPVAQLDKRSIDCSRIKEKNSVKDEILITNKGGTTLNINSIQVFQPSINISLSEKKIAPGESATLKIKLLKRYLDRSKNKLRVLLTTNDPNSPEIFINLIIGN